LGRRGVGPPQAKKNAMYGRSIIYSLKCDRMSELLTFLAKDCCQGQPELCGIMQARRR
jgi:hypothetical protein